MTRLAGDKALPTEVVEHIIAKTDGVPLYLEELTRTILASDILREADERFALTGPLSSLAIPATLQGSLMARLDRLPQVREIAQVGSVLGREFATRRYPACPRSARRPCRRVSARTKSFDQYQGTHMADHPPLKFAAIGLDHRHIYHQVGRLLGLGAECKGYYARDSAVPLEGFVRRFPDLPRVREVRALLEDPEIQLIVSAAIPSERAEIALEAMRHGKDVMVDKPAVITPAQLADVMRLQRETGRIWSVNFSERFEVRAMTRAAELVQAGAIGRVVQTVGFGPHRLNRHLRPEWFFGSPRVAAS